MPAGIAPIGVTTGAGITGGVITADAITTPTTPITMTCFMGSAGFMVGITEFILDISADTMADISVATTVDITDHT